MMTKDVKNYNLNDFPDNNVKDPGSKYLEKLGDDIGKFKSQSPFSQSPFKNPENFKLFVYLNEILFLEKLKAGLKKDNSEGNNEFKESALQSLFKSRDVEEKNNAASIQYQDLKAACASAGKNFKAKNNLAGKDIDKNFRNFLTSSSFCGGQLNNSRYLSKGYQELLNSKSEEDNSQLSNKLLNDILCEAIKFHLRTEIINEALAPKSKSSNDDRTTAFNKYIEKAKLSNDTDDTIDIMKIMALFKFVNYNDEKKRRIPFIFSQINLIDNKQHDENIKEIDSAIKEIQTAVETLEKSKEIIPTKSLTTLSELMTEKYRTEDKITYSIRHSTALKAAMWFCGGLFLLGALGTIAAITGGLGLIPALSLGAMAYPALVGSSGAMFVGHVGFWKACDKKCPKKYPANKLNIINDFNSKHMAQKNDDNQSKISTISLDTTPSPNGGQQPK